MDPIAIELNRLADYLLAQAAENPQGRASQRIDLGHQQLRMTAIGFIAGAELPEHRNPGEAVLQVVRGRIRLSEPPRSIEFEPGQTIELEPRTMEVEPGTIVRIPDGLHSVEALEPSVIVLTAITKPRFDDPAAPSPTAESGEHAI